MGLCDPPLGLPPSGGRSGIPLPGEGEARAGGGPQFHSWSLGQTSLSVQPFGLRQRKMEKCSCLMA